MFSLLIVPDHLTSLASGLFDHLLGDITQSNHANSLPNAQSNARSNTTVETLETVLRVDISEGAADGHLLRPVGVVLLALHLDTHDLDRLVPGGQSTTERTRGDLLDRAEFLPVLLAGELADLALGNTRQSEARAPVGDLAHRDGVDALVDTLDTFGAVDLHERLHRARWLAAGQRFLVFRDLDCFHAGAETHGCVGLSQATDHTAGNTADEVVGSRNACVVLGFGGYEEQDCAFRRGFDPGPRDQSLVDCAGQIAVLEENEYVRTAKDTTTAPDAAD